MTRDLLLTMVDIRSEFTAEVTSIGLTGGVSQIQNLGPFMTQVLDIPTERTATIDLSQRDV